VRVRAVHSPVRVFIVAVTAALLAIFAGGLPARADPTLGQIEAQLASLWGQAEPLIEKYNAVHDQYVKNQAKVASLQKQIAPLETQLELAQAKIGAMAAKAYQSGASSPVTAFLVSGSPDDFVDQLTYMDMLAKTQSDQVASVRDAKAKYDAQKQPLDDLNAQLKQQDGDLANQRKTIEQKLDEMQKLRVKAYGSSGQIGAYRQWTCPAQYNNTKGYKAADFACKQAGKPYIWAAAGPSSYDCSGLTMTAWAQVGVYMPHNAYAQAHSMKLVSRANLQIGDLVFYYSDIRHVAIYVGDGHIMAAPQPGDVVRMQSIDSAPIWGYGHPG
jgi:cell wall-associated NlpC family hydrolase